MNNLLIEGIYATLFYMWFLSAGTIFINSKFVNINDLNCNGGKITKITKGRLYEKFHIDWDVK